MLAQAPGGALPAQAPGGALPAQAPGGAVPAQAPGGAGPGGDRFLVLRRPPLGHVLPTAHDMSREFRVVSGLAGTKVPVAEPVAFCDDAEVVGAPFYLMEHVPGAVLRSRQDTAVLAEQQATELSERLADMLAAIHGVDVEATGLGGLGRGAGYLTRQLSRWQRQWELSKTREVPGYDELVRRLTATLPPEGETTLVHGDFRLDNVLVTLAPQPRITAVVDWEMATLGDPLADLGLTLVYWTDASTESGWRSAVVCGGQPLPSQSGRGSSAPGAGSRRLAQTRQDPGAPLTPGRGPAPRSRRACRSASACRAILRPGAPLTPDLYRKGRAIPAVGSRPIQEKNP
jgi:aminoglycoside phosphotransferase (APT) family kinase protein